MQEKDIIKQKYENKNIVMVSSLKKYKGIDIFVSLAEKCPSYSFVLVLSALADDIKKYFLHTNLPENIQLAPQQNNLIQYYINASVVINLTVPHLCVEAFGMTLIEGFHFGTPCIAPDFGGPREIVEHGKNGFLVNPCDEDAVKKAINTILQSEKQYRRFAENVLRLKNQFSIDVSINTIINLINSL